MIFNFEKFRNVPIASVVLQHLLSDYQFPKNKIISLEKDGTILRLKKGLYVVTEKFTGKTISRELIANHLYGPSYISLETALSYFNMIPERVYEVRSMTTKRSKNFNTKLGVFTYQTTSKEYFSIGLRIENFENEIAFLIATPTKALCDLIVSTSHLRIQSLKAMQSYLLEDLRIEQEWIKDLDLDIVYQSIPFSKKKNELNFLAQVITYYQLINKNL
ncbi:MAG: hypothetical protein H6Q25_645 [Bacteroidetes bacterium]|nr:hypothetical protein [Bacteroidota bacterium]